MRNAISCVLVLLVALVVATPDTFSPFSSPLLEGLFVQTNGTSDAYDLLRRQSNACPSGYNSCAGLGAPGLCCNTNSNCSPDMAGHVACCPRGAVCTGTIGATTPATGTAAFSTATTTATTNNGLVFVSTATSTATSTTIPGLITSTTGGGQFIIASAASSSGTYTRSTVPNSYFPFAYISLTYFDAAVCSSAYSSCQTAASSCTAALGGGSYGVTVNAPIGGTTVSGITTKLPASYASSICSSLSSQACFGLKLESCTVLAPGSNGVSSATGAAVTSVDRGASCSREPPVYCVVAGVALGLAGRLLT